MFGKKFPPSNGADWKGPVDMLVPNYTFDEDGNVIAVAVPASEGINVPQDGERLELRNVAKYGTSLDDDRYITPQVMDKMKLANVIADRARHFEETHDLDYGKE